MTQNNLLSRLCSELAHNLVSELLHANASLHLTLTHISKPAPVIILSGFPVSEQKVLTVNAKTCYLYEFSFFYPTLVGHRAASFASPENLKTHFSVHCKSRKYVRGSGLCILTCC